MSVRMNFLERLLKKGKPITYLSDFNLDTSFFYEKDESRIIEYLDTHIERYSCLPKLRTVEKTLKVKFPNAPKESLQYWSDCIIRGEKIRKICKHVKHAGELLNKGEEEKALKVFSKISTESELSTGPNASRVITLSDGLEIMLEEHDRCQLSFGSNDVPYGFPYLDEISGGLPPGDTVIIAGDTGIGKTYLLCKMAHAAHKAGYSPMFVTMEMRSTAILRRISAIRLGINEKLIRRGLLQTLTSKQRVVNDIRQSKDEPPFYFIDAGFNFDVEELKNFVIRYKPSVLYVDGAYMLQTRNGSRNSKWDDIAEVATQLKIIVRNTNISACSTYNLKDKREVFGGKTMKYLASVVLFMQEEEGGGEYGNECCKLLSIKKGRYGEHGTVRITYDMLNSRIEQAEIISQRRQSLEY